MAIEEKSVNNFPTMWLACKLALPVANLFPGMVLLNPEGGAYPKNSRDLAETCPDKSFTVELVEVGRQNVVVKFKRFGSRRPERELYRTYKADEIVSVVGVDDSSYSAVDPDNPFYRLFVLEDDDDLLWAYKTTPEGSAWVSPFGSHSKKPGSTRVERAFGLNIAAFSPQSLVHLSKIGGSAVS